MTLEQIRVVNVERGEEVFHKINEWTPMEWACAMAGEAGEVCNAVKKLRRLETGTNTPKDPQNERDAIDDIANELGDLLAYVDLLAARLGINLAEAFREKFNAVSLRMKSTVFI